MLATRGRLTMLIGGSALASAGWGAVLPYVYTDIADARGFGPGTAAITFTALAVGSLLAAPIAGQLADRHDPVVVAALSRFIIAVAVLALGVAASPLLVWLTAAAVGAGVAATQPAVQVILLAWTSENRRRDVFAWQFIAMNLALAVGGFVGGFAIDLSTPGGARPVYVIAAAGAAVSAAIVYLVGRGRPAHVAAVGGTPEHASYRTLLATPAIRWLLGVTFLLTLACYAQYESGLPAYALDAVNVSPRLLGIAVAINAILVAALTAPVVAATKNHSPTTLLAACATIWIGCWALLGLPLLVSGVGGAAVFAGYAMFSLGETMLAPVLSPLAASLAPEGATGRTLGAVTGATTVAAAIGPALAGALLALHLPALFIALQLACCLGAIVATTTLGALMRGRPARPRWDLSIADDLVLA